MQFFHDKESLAHHISQLGGEIARTRQLYLRLIRLLPARYGSLLMEHRSRYDAGKARRIAYMDERYLAYVDEINSLSFRLHKLRIEWETQLLLNRCPRRP